MTSMLTLSGLAMCLLAGACLAAIGSLGPWTVDGAALACLLFWAAATAVLLARDRRRIWSPAVIFFSVFAVFHFGLALVVWSGGQTQDLPWFTDAAVPTAFIVVLWGGIGLLVGMLLPEVARMTWEYLIHRRAGAEASLASSPSSALPVELPDETTQVVLLPRVGFALVVLSVLAWCALVLPPLGGRLWGVSYGEFLLATDEARLGWVYFWMALGFAMSVLPGSRATTWWSVAVFGLWAIVALPIGLRGEVMFPAAAACMITSHRLRRIGLIVTLVVMIAGLSLAALFKEVRKQGWSGVEWSAQTINPASAVKELGQSLRPTVEVIRWVETGDRLLGGGSYWAPMERGFLRLFPIKARDSGDDDERLLNVRVQQRVGPIGFSPVAEAYYNWGLVGVVLVHLVIGWIVAVLAVDPPSLLRQAVMSAILVPLLIHIRNSFAAVPAQVVVGLVVVFALVLAEQWLRARQTGSGRLPAEPADSSQNR